MTMNSLAGIVGAVALAIAAVSVTAAPSDARDGVRFRCNARGPGQITLHARYEERVRPRRTRQKFTGEFEARAGGAFVPGQQISFFVDTVKVGTVALAAVAGDVAGELELDTNKGTFPNNFPPVTGGETVEAKTAGGATVLGCELQ